MLSRMEPDQKQPQEMKEEYRKIACHHLVVDCKLIPFAPCVVEFNSKSRQVISYRKLITEESLTEWIGGTVEIKNGEILI